MVDSQRNAIENDSHIFTLTREGNTLDAPILQAQNRLGFAALRVDLVYGKVTLEAIRGMAFSAVPVYGDEDFDWYEPRDKPQLVYVDVNVSTSRTAQDQLKPMEDGEHRLLYRVSRLFGDLDAREGYETYLSHKFTIEKSG